MSENRQESGLVANNTNVQQMGMQGGPVQLEGGFPMMSSSNFPQIVPVGMGLGQFGFMPQEQMAQQYQFLLSNMPKQEILQTQGGARVEGAKEMTKKKKTGNPKELAISQY